ncbi:DgyrCDS9443 [Dimorphilus gyrociliatus]|uniref:DgyrCDS9443 n=1 Tax=Dimorphilus gyrociliatus TaxID=2664684 RepID=A0A7I8VX06_9ANNE|nr:DgyrCDS9443 [Dimorphilus gyrociliatus]
MGRYNGKACKFLCMLCLTSTFFFVEIIVGYLTHSLALVGDAYHMLSDIVALLVGFAAVKISKKKTKKNTYGWVRAEVLGALVNSVFLLALCFTILVEACQRLFKSEEIENPTLLLIVGSIGLAVNLIGLFLFHGHAHSHGGHAENVALLTEINETDKKLDDEIDEKTEEHNTTAISSIQNGDANIEVKIENGKNCTKKKVQSSSQLNMKGVFLHILGDALGSVIVVISALIVKFVKSEWRHKVDPAMSILLVVILFVTTLPLLKESSHILLQTVPTNICIDDLEKRLKEEVEGIESIHEFHVWQLTGSRIIATAHIRCQNMNDYAIISEKVKKFFHNEGIHSTTVQPEFNMVCEFLTHK